MKLDDVKKLHQKKYREAFGCFLVEGEHLALELQKAAASHPRLLGSELYVTPKYEHWSSPFTTHVVSERQMARIAATETPQGIVAVVPMPAPSPPASAGEDGERAVYLHEIQDPGNLGTILRTLAWFGGWRCLIGPASVDPYNPKAVRASMGAIFHVPIELEVGLETLCGRFERIACLDMAGESPASPAFGTFQCYLFGNEARGVPRERLTALEVHRFAIPGCGGIESLNVASVVGMCAYELNRSVARPTKRSR